MKVVVPDAEPISLDSGVMPRSGIAPLWFIEIFSEETPSPVTVISDERETTIGFSSYMTVKVVSFVRVAVNQSELALNDQSMFDVTVKLLFRMQSLSILIQVKHSVPGYCPDR